MLANGLLSRPARPAQPHPITNLRSGDGANQVQSGGGDVGPPLEELEAEKRRPWSSSNENQSQARYRRVTVKKAN